MKKAVLRNKYAMPEEVIEKSVEEALEIASKEDDLRAKHATRVKIDLEEKPNKEGKKKSGRKLSI